jgi:photosystem II stability/assembly factor-like uncharacterized protein
MMMTVYSRAARTACVLLLLCSSFLALAQSIDPSVYGGLKWRMIGPFRAGRVTCVAGVPSNPALYYMGTPGGGVWRTTDAGNTWEPIFDQVRVPSIGALAVSESNPNIIYVGTGEQIRGNGVYKSTDAGKTWTNVGLENTHAINALLIDPRNPDIVLVGVVGDFANGAERGIYKSTDGGKTWQHTLFKDNDTGVMDMTAAPDSPNVIYATLQHRQAGPPVRGQTPTEQDATIYRSTDQGSTWSVLEGKGLPSEAMGRVGVAVAPGTSGKTVYSIVEQGLFRSDDSGATWTQSTKDPRVVGSGYFSRVYVDPKDAAILYVAQTTMYRSQDGGRTFTAEFGAPSGDDYHNLWINPLNTQYMVSGVDQGAVVSVNGGRTWSSWYNQPTGQFYHVSTDNKFPYNVYAAQQDSGTASVPSRGDYGQITYRDWSPIGGFEFAFIAADPLNPNYIYTGGWYGSVLRFDRTTGQVVHVFVRSPKYRTANMAPIQFSPQDPHSLYVGAQYVMKTTDGGNTWLEVSPDLTKKSDTTERRGQQPPTITTLALSTRSNGTMWAGTSNGLVHVSRDARTWQDVTPKGLPERSNIVALEASHHDAGTAYAVVNAFQQSRPIVYRTHDYGHNWQPIITGLSETFIARIVRDDPERKGLLYAGTETGAWMSVDDGDHWQSLQMNLPVTSVRDLAVQGTDLVAATFGRALWILDDVSPLRQINASSLSTPTQLFKPAKAVRTRWDVNQDTPLPVETPVGKNPPDGAIIDYFLQKPSATPLNLSILDLKGDIVRHYSSTPPADDNTPGNAPDYWFADPSVPSKNSGINRFVWDMRYDPPKTMRYSYWGNTLDYIEYTLAEHAIPGETPRQQPQGPLVIPGGYTVVLEADGKTYRQPLTVTLDPRVRVSQQDLTTQRDTLLNISAQMAVSYDLYAQAAAVRSALQDRQNRLGGSDKNTVDSATALTDALTEVQEGSKTEAGFGPANRELARLVSMIGSGDARPAAVLQQTVDQLCGQLTHRLTQWRELNTKTIPTFNQLLQKQDAAPLPVTTNIPSLRCSAP